MANTGYSGIDVRQVGNRLLFDGFLQDSAGAILATGTTTLYLYELQDDGTLKSYDFNDNTFKTTALTTETQAMTHRTGNNSTTNTGVWTVALTTLTGFTVGAVYYARVKNTGASPTDQIRKFQYGGAPVDKKAALNTFSFTMISSTDHVSAATGKTVTVAISKDGAAFSNATNTPATEIANGFYQITLTAAEMDATNIAVKCTATGCDQRNFSILPER